MEQEFIELDLEMLIASMGDDVATLRNENPEDEIADTLELAAQVLGSAVKDAMRYRWLRATTNFVTSKGERIDVRSNPELWDSTIDECIAKRDELRCDGCGETMSEHNRLAQCKTPNV